MTRRTLWQLLPIGLALIVVFPLVNLISKHLLTPNTIPLELPFLFKNTSLLLLGVASLSTFFGVSTAILCTLFNTPLKKYWTWLLILPLAFPAYVMAFVSINLYDQASPLYALLLNWGISLAPIRSSGGLIFILSLCLYPYIFLATRTACLSINPQYFEMAKNLGHTQKSMLANLVLPLCKPAILAGILLVIMESLANFGAVYLFNFPTLSTAIYEHWFTLFSLSSAAKIAGILLIVAIVLLAWEYRIRKHCQSTASRNIKTAPPFRLNKWQQGLAISYLSLLLLTALILPIGQLISWSIAAWPTFSWQSLWTPLKNSLIISTLLASALSGLCFLWILGQRFVPNTLLIKLSQMACLGYAIPGTVLAIAIHQVLPLTYTLWPLLIASGIRLISVSYGPINAFSQSVSKQIDQLCQMHRLPTHKQITVAYFPIFKRSLLVSAIIVFIDSIKEMPIALMTRPIGWDTLAVKLFAYTTEGDWHNAAIPALLLVVLGLVSTSLMLHLAEKSKSS